MPEPESTDVTEPMTFAQAKALKNAQDSLAFAGMGEAMIREGEDRAAKEAADQAARVEEARNNPNIIDKLPWATDKPAEETPPASQPADRMPGT